jgi:hypothetical protein
MSNVPALREEIEMIDSKYSRHGAFLMVFLPMALSGQKAQESSTSLGPQASTEEWWSPIRN